jgi:hypothetical protein
MRPQIEDVVEVYVCQHAVERVFYQQR